METMRCQAVKHVRPNPLDTVALTVVRTVGKEDDRKRGSRKDEGFEASRSSGVLSAMEIFHQLCEPPK
jgi:hypothetical protein